MNDLGIAKAFDDLPELDVSHDDVEIELQTTDGAMRPGAVD